MTGVVHSTASVANTFGIGMAAEACNLCKAK